MKESEKLDKYFDVLRKLNKMWNIRMISIIAGDLGIVPKNMETKLK